MAFQMSCPSCSRQVRVPDSLIGQRVKCPTCLTTFVAEENAPVSTAPPPLPAPLPPAPEKVTSERPPGRDPDEPKRRWRDFDDEDDSRYRRPPRFREGGPRADALPHRGGLVLTFGILSIAFTLMCFICWPVTSGLGLGFGIPAWIMGQGDLKKMQSGMIDNEGDGITRAGWIMGIVGTGLGALSIVVGLVLVLVVILTNH